MSNFFRPTEIPPLTNTNVFKRVSPSFQTTSNAWINVPLIEHDLELRTLKRYLFKYEMIYGANSPNSTIMHVRAFINPTGLAFGLATKINMTNGENSTPITPNVFYNAVGQNNLIYQFESTFTDTTFRIVGESYIVANNTPPIGKPANIGGTLIFQVRNWSGNGQLVSCALESCYSLIELPPAG